MKYRMVLGLVTISMFVLAGFSSLSFSQTVNREKAVQLARETVDKNFPSGTKINKANINIRTSVKTDFPFYVCDVDGSGFVLVGKDEKFPEIMAFSYESSFPSDLSQAPEFLQNYIELLIESCNQLSSSQDALTATSKLSHENTIQKTAIEQKSLFIPPLMTTKWKADSSFCAEFPAGAMANPSTVIAMGQVFRYFEAPAYGMGEYCYLYGPSSQEICTDFGFMFDYSSMPDLTAGEQVPKLLFFMAVAGRLQPSGADLLTYRETLPEYFFYSDNMRKVEYWEHDFIAMLKHQLAMSRPVPAEWSNQSFVIDGYYDTDFFHFNFGMGGVLDGFYILDFPMVKTDADHFLLSAFVNYHPKSYLPAPQGLTIAAAGDSLNISWSLNLPDSLSGRLNKVIVLRDGLIPVAETSSTSIMIHPKDFGISSEISCVAQYNTYGASELSESVKYISDLRLADIPSLELRQAINIQLGYTEDLNRIPYVGELEMVKKLNVDFADQRGIDQLTQLRHLFVDGLTISGIREGDYLNSLNYILLHRCRQFDFTVLENTSSLNVIQGSDGLPYDLYDLRHNSNAGVLSLATHDAIINNCGDLYGIDKYFQNLTFFDLYHITYLTIDSCYISYESYNDILPNIKGNAAAIEHTSPSSFVPCYPTPARNTNVPNTSKISWQSNFNEEPNVFNNIYIGKTRDQLQLVAPFMTGNSYDYNFENNVDYYWRVESFHNDTTYYSGIYHFSTYESFPMPFIENFDDYYAKCDVSFESPYWIDFGDELTAPAKTSREIKRSGRYSLEFGAESDAGFIIEPKMDSSYAVEFYFRNNRAEFGIDLLQGSNDGDTLAVNSRISLFGDNLGTFDFGESSEQFLFIPSDWNHARILLDMPSGHGTLIINDVEISKWNWNIQKDGAANTNPFTGIRFSNSAATGAGLIDDIDVRYFGSTGIQEIQLENLSLAYNPFYNEIQIKGDPGIITDLELFDLRGRKIITFASHGKQRFQLDNGIPNGVFVMKINCVDGRSLTQKISIVR